MRMQSGMSPAWPSRIAVAGLMLGVAAAAGSLELFEGRAFAGEPSADEILKMLDHAQGCFDDLSSEVTMSVYEPGAKEGRIYKFHQISKGHTKRVARFTAPGDINGMGFLSEGRDTLYVYLPDMKKIRRMGTHINNQSMMGSDLTNDDMSAAELSASYKPRFISADDKEWIIEIDALPGNASDFVKVKVWVRKDIKQATKMEDYDKAGKLVRTITREKYTKDEGPGEEHWTPALMTYVDHRRNDHKTTLELTNNKINQKIGDDEFSQSALRRGN